jgi:hypothetical protein
VYDWFATTDLHQKELNIKEIRHTKLRNVFRKYAETLVCKGAEP